MANTSEFLFLTSGATPLIGGVLPTSPDNGFVSRWCDKRSATSVGLSVRFYGGTPTGTLTVETSNAPEQAGAANMPNNNGDDAETLTGSSTTVTASAGPFQWQLADLPARWVRVRYVSVETTAGLSANVYANAPHESA